MKWKDGVTASSEQGISRKAGANVRYQHQLDFTEPACPCKNYPMLTKAPQFQPMGCYWTHTCGFAGIAGYTQISAVHLSLTWLPQRRAIWGSNGTRSPPLLPLLHLPHDAISIMCPACSSTVKLLCGHSTPKGKCMHTFLWRLCSALHKYLWPPSQIQNE